MKNWKINIISLVALVAFTWNGTMVFADKNAAGEKKNKDEYIQLVVAALRSHVKALSHLTAKEIKYSDNVARHANAIKDTFDMLGPMDWHAAEATRLQQEKATKNTKMLTQKDFNKMVEISTKRIARLRQSAHRWLRDKDRNAFMKDLDAMMQSCKDCHALLPKNTAPAVWKGIKGQL